MKKQKSSILNLTEVPSSDDETEKATSKTDEEELRSYLKIIEDDESSQEQVTPKRPKNVKRLKTLSIKGSPIIKPKKVISKKSPQNFLAQGDNFKKLHEKAKKLGADSLQYSKRKNYKYVIECDGKKIHFCSPNTEDYITHKDPVRREKYLSKAKKITDKDGRLAHKLPFYPNYWSVNLLN